MKNRPNFRASAHTLAFYGARLALIVGAFFAQLVLAGCASTEPVFSSTQTTVTDTASLRQVQRLVAVSVPGDSAKIITRIGYDDKTGLFRPVTIYSHSGNLVLAFTLDALGVVRANATSSPFVAQVPVTDTERTRTTTTTAKQKDVVATPAHYGKFVWGCIAFTVLAVVMFCAWLYSRFVSPLSFLKWL